MKKIEQELEDLGLEYRESDNPERQRVDFIIEDGEDNVAFVWGDRFDDVEFECNHPTVEYEDDEMQGECPLCGCWCDWHWVESADDGVTIRERVPHEWYPRREPGGILAELLGELEKGESC